MARVNPIPEGCHSVQPYMIFAGCAKAMEFYAKAFGAREVMCMKSPEGVGGPCRDADRRQPHHDGGRASADGGVRQRSTMADRRSRLMFYTEDCDAMYAKALAAGAKSVREPADQPYGSAWRRSGSLRLQVVDRHTDQGHVGNGDRKGREHDAGDGMTDRCVSPRGAGAAGRDRERST